MATREKSSPGTGCTMPIACTCGSASTSGMEFTGAQGTPMRCSLSSHSARGVAAIMAGVKRSDWLDRLQRCGVPCAPVNAIPEVLEEPQVQALGMVQQVPGEDFALVALPLSFDGERPKVKSAAPRLGEHNARVERAAE